MNEAFSRINERKKGGEGKILKGLDFNGDKLNFDNLSKKIKNQEENKEKQKEETETKKVVKENNEQEFIATKQNKEIKDLSKI